jgi:chromate transporter
MATTVEVRVGKKPRQMGTLLSLFFIFLKIGAFTWGGGYCMLPLIKCEVVEKKRWLTPDGFMSGIALSASVPGAMAINIASFVGSQVAGTQGSLVATLGAVIPSYVSIVAVAFFLMRFRELKVVQNFFRGANPAIIALLASAVWDLGRDVFKNWGQIIISAGLLGLLIFLDLNPILIILIAAVLGLFQDVKK